MKNGKKRAITGFGFVLLMVLAFALFAYATLHTVVVKGVSMYPTFKDGQRVLVCRAYWLVGPIKAKDVVVLKDAESSDGYIIKRVYRMAGEKVDEVNCPRGWRLSSGQYVVPAGKIYVLGDNRAQSEDSRYFGAVDIGSVLGKVVVRR
jgi:signal peptidase I